MADATTRAARLLAGDTADLHLTQHQDAVRIAAGNPGPEWFHHLIQNTGTKPTAFARLTRAWRHGGPAGITGAEQPYAPDPTVMKAARTALDAALAEMTDSPTHLRTWRNRLTHLEAPPFAVGPFVVVRLSFRLSWPPAACSGSGTTGFDAEG